MWASGKGNVRGSSSPNQNGVLQHEEEGSFRVLPWLGLEGKSSNSMGSFSSSSLSLSSECPISSNPASPKMMCVGSTKPKESCTSSKECCVWLKSESSSDGSL